MERKTLAKGINKEKVISTGKSLGMNLCPEEAEEYLMVINNSLLEMELLDTLPDEIPQTTYARTPGYEPHGEENKLNAWYVKTSVRGRGVGKLEGKRVVLKDNIFLQGVKMMNGGFLEGFVCDHDATVVRRVLEEGGEIAGKGLLVCFIRETTC